MIQAEDIVLIAMANELTSQPRVFREASALKETGRTVQLVGVDVSLMRGRTTNEHGFDVYRLRLPDVWLVQKAKAFRRQWTGQGPSAQDSTDVASRDAGRIRRPNGVDLVGDLRNLVFWLSSNVAFYFALRRIRHDVVHVHDLPPAAAALLTAPRSGAKIVYEPHEHWREKFPSWPISRTVRRLLEGAIVRRSDLNIAVNESIAESLSEEFGVVLPTVVMNVSEYDTVAKVGSVNDPPELVYHGVVEEGRGVDLLIEAVARMTTPVKVRVLGYGRALAEVRRQVAELRLQDAVSFETPVPREELINTIATSDVAVVPLEARLGYRLALPNKLFEAMSAGLAIVATDLPEIRRVIESTQNGILVPFESRTQYVRDLAAALDRITDDPGSLAQRKCKSARAAQSKFNWAKHKADLLDKYPPSRNIPDE